MTAAEASRVAHSDPVPVLTARWGEATATARQRVAALTDSLRELDTLTRQLAGHDLEVVTGLGPIGDAAMSVWKTTEEHKARHDHDFQMPKGAAA